jgi:hypothetical protein
MLTAECQVPFTLHLLHTNHEIAVTFVIFNAARYGSELLKGFSAQVQHWSRDSAMNAIETIREQVRKGYIVGEWEALGKRGMSLTDRMSFLEDLFLCGFQSAQSAAGLTPDSPEFVVDVHIELARSGMQATGEIKSWHIRRKDGGSELLEFEPVSRSDRRKRTSAKSGNAKGQGA